MKEVARRVYISAGVLALLMAALSCDRDRMPRLQVPLPFGMVDSIGEPRQDGTVAITGWALSEDPIQTVSLYIEGRYVTSARLHLPRPDVNRVHPAFGAVKPGWAIEIDSRLFPGQHEVVVQARTIHGAVSDLGRSRIVFGRVPR